MKELERQIVKTRFEKPEGVPFIYAAYSPEYVGFHSRRFAILCELVEQLGAHERTKLLDIGPTYTSKMFYEHFKCRVDSLGFDPDEETAFGKNYQFDLNLAQSEETWRKDLGDYDIVVIAEVIEHLYTAPRLVLQYLKTLVKPGGHIVLQTPNALGLKMRLQLLFGKHPFEQISERPGSPNHYRESTLKEFKAFAEGAGLEIVLAGHYNYFNPSFRQNNRKIKPWMGALFFRFSDILPPSMKRGLTLVMRRPMA